MNPQPVSGIASLLARGQHYPLDRSGDHHDVGAFADKKEISCVRNDELVRLSAEEGLLTAVGVNLFACEPALARRPLIGTSCELFTLMQGMANDAEAGDSAMLHAMEAEQE